MGIQYFTLTFNFSELQTITDPELMVEKLMGMFWPIVIMSLVNLLFTTILNHYVIYRPVDENNSVLVSCYKSLKYFIPYLIIMVLFIFFASVAIVVGLLALIVGVFFTMLYVLTIYMFILPMLLAEGANIGSVISRSFRFAHKDFWTNMGWVAVFLIIILVISVISSAIIMIPFTGKFLNILSNPEDVTAAFDFMTNPVYLGLSALVSALYMPVMPIFATILYFNGRAKEDGVEVKRFSDNSDTTPRVTVEDLYAKPRDENQL
jgi:hypothetical protein